MQARIILASTNSELIAQVRDAFSQTGLRPDALVVSEGKSSAAIRNLIRASDDPVGAVIIDLSDGAESNLQLMSTVKDDWPNVVVAAAHGQPSTETILSALRSGAGEFLSPPFDLTHLIQAVGQAAAVTDAPKSRGRVVCVLPAQSGNGASTVALHIAHAASRGLAEKALLIELDFHSSVLRERLKIQPKHSLADLLERRNELDELWNDVVEEWNGFDVLPAPASSRAVSCKSLGDLNDLVQYARGRYSVVVVDLPSALLSSSRAVLAHTTDVCLVCTPEMTSLHLARRRMAELVDLGIPTTSIRAVINRAGSAQRISVQDISEVLGASVYRTIDNDYLALRDTWARGELLPHQSGLGQQLFELGSSMAGLQQASAPRRSQALRSLFSVFH